MNGNFLLFELYFVHRRHVEDFLFCESSWPYRVSDIDADCVGKRCKTQIVVSEANFMQYLTFFHVVAAVNDVIFASKLNESGRQNTVTF